jgi:hypothetical protein
MLKKITTLVLVIWFAVSAISQAGEVPKVIATGDWSKPVADNRGRALCGRLVLCEEERSDDLREVVVYVELQDASDGRGSSMQLFFHSGLKCELLDSEKRPVKPTSFPFGGGVPRSEWVTLPSDASIRLRTTPFGIRRAKAIAIAPYLSDLWIIDDSDKSAYYFSGTLTIDPAKDNKPPADGDVWRGTIAFPAVKIVNRARRIDEAIAFIKERYKVPVRRIDDRTLDVIWESGAVKSLEELKERVKKQFEIDVISTTGE